MGNELISVVIPMFNVEKYIEGCIQSVTQGIYQNIEILCIDDGSTDNTAENVRKLQEKDARIRLFEQANTGVSAARNLGIDNAVGSYIAFIDADDWVTEDYLSTLQAVAHEKQADIVKCNYIGINRFDPTIQFTHKDNYTVTRIHEWDTVRTLVRNVWGCLYKRDICQRFEVGNSIGEDLLFNLLIVSQKRKLRAWKCSKPMYVHYWRPGSLISHAGIMQHYHVCLSMLKASHSLPVKKYAIVAALKQALSFRYFMTAFPKAEALQAEANRLVKKVAALFLCCWQVPLYEKIFYLPFIVSPSLYKAYRDKRMAARTKS